MDPKRWMFLSTTLAACFVAGSALAEAPAAGGKTGEAAEAEAQAFLATWESKGRALCENNEPGCAAAGLALVSAAKSFEAAQQRNKAIVTRKIILDPRYHLDYTDYGKTTAFDLAADYQAVAEYAEAASGYESAARHFPKFDQAPQALTDAVVLRLGLDDIDAAVKDAEMFAKNYGGSRPAEVAAVNLAIASFHEEKGDAAQAKKWLDARMAQIDKSGGVDLRVRAHGLRGRLLAEQKDVKGATAEFDVVRAVFKDMQAAVASYDAMGGSDEARIRRLGKGLDMLGEALFFAAEQKRATVDAIRYPEYKGNADKDSVLRHINTKVVDWIKKKREAIEEAERAYSQVMAIQPFPPPRWVIASAAKVGTLWGKFVAEFRAAPIPKEWKGTGNVPGTTMSFPDVRRDYYAALDEASEPQKQKAKAAFEVCTKYSAKFQWYDEHVRYCRLWLEKSYHKQYVRFDELLPKPVAAPYVIMPLPVPEPKKD